MTGNEWETDERLSQLSQGAARRLETLAVVFFSLCFGLSEFSVFVGDLACVETHKYKGDLSLIRYLVYLS